MNITRREVKRMSEEPAESPTTSGHSPNRARSPRGYYFPFPSPDRVDVYEPRTITEDAVYNTPAISELVEPVIQPVIQLTVQASTKTKQAEVISISSTPDPSQPRAPTRVSSRRNKGCPPERYADPDQRLLAVERDSQKKHQSIAEEGGNNGEEGARRGSAEDIVAVAVPAAVEQAPIIHNSKPIHSKDVVLPESYKQAIKSIHWEHWQAAMAQQIEDLNVQKDLHTG
jgi:hypothetical protein